MFMGEQQHTIDAKGRLIVPAKYREGLGEKFVVTKGLDQCLQVYPMEEWEKFEKKLEALPSKAMKIVRFFTSGATECELDGQGRIMIPPTLRAYAGLEKEIVSIGVVNKVEIWNRDRWNEYNQNIFEDEDMSDIMNELGL
ncbi:MAG: division/cell wall cluster transcriptional repressor MraZ [Clostridiales bacterium]|nr:division/cell wall cluster transcriptional repressor MraZ [Clostridiales bacterium]